MEKIVDFVKENLGGVLITCFGVLVPGALTIAVLKWSFIQNWTF